MSWKNLASENKIQLYFYFIIIYIFRNVIN